jgi:hypothetical protein
METTHTQGEWAFDDNEIYSESTDHGAAICTMNTTSMHFTEEEVKANVRLIAAAPDLLEALQSLVQYLEWREDFIVEDHKEGEDNQYSEALTAIQKATQP